LCTGCRACQVACVARHEGRFGVFTARLRIVKDEPMGLDQPHVCRLCRRAPCLDACPTGALSRDDSTSAIVLSAEACDSCSLCIEACPFGMVALHYEIGLPLICDLCGGEPACVLRCPTGAIAYGDLPPESEDPPAMHLVRPDRVSSRPDLGADG
jgi:Fe-S-cluster-containing dehydrogenase component